MPTIARVFGIIDDATAGGEEYDVLKTGSPTVPDATTFWPVTGGTFDPGIERIDRNDEVRGRRANVAPAPFRAAPMMTVPVAAYRKVVEKAIYKALGSNTITGGSTVPYVHTMKATGFGTLNLPAFHAQMVRDDLNIKMGGCTMNRFNLEFPLDGEGRAEFEMYGKWFSDYATAAPSATFSLGSEDVFTLRDAVGYVDATLPVVNEAQQISITGGPTGGDFTLTYDGQTTAAIAYDAAAAAVQTAIEALSNVGTGNVTCAGGPLPGSAVTATFVNELGAAWGVDPVQMTADSSGLTGGSSPSVTVTTATPAATYGTAIPDLQGFSISFTNNLVRKWYAGRNIETRSLGGRNLKLWFPAENKAQAAPDITFTLNFGNTVKSQEIAMWFAQQQKLVFTCVAGKLSAGLSAFSEAIRVVIYNSVTTGGGAEALTAREDITSAFDGGVYLDSTGKDLEIQVVSDTATLA